MGHRVRALIFTLLLLTGLAFASIFSVSDAGVIQAGRQAHAEVMKQYGAAHIRSEETRIERLGRRLARHAKRRDVQYKFYLLNSNIINALATPDGSVHVMRGLVENFPDDRELSFIIGHEITHVERRHGKQQIEKMTETQAGADILALVLGRNSAAAQLGIKGAAVWLSMKYSRDFETQADEGGMLLLQESGIDPHAGPRALSRLETLEKEKPNLLEKYFGTHPLPADRVTHAEAFADALTRKRKRR